MTGKEKVTEKGRYNGENRQVNESRNFGNYSSKTAKRVDPLGFEPKISAMSRQRPNQLDHRSIALCALINMFLTYKNILFLYGIGFNFH